VSLLEAGQSSPAKGCKPAKNDSAASSGDLLTTGMFQAFSDDFQAIIPGNAMALFSDPR